MTDRMQRRRRVWPAAVAVVLGAAATAGASALVWWSATAHSALTADRDVTWKGSALLPELVPIALVALAGYAASFAVRGRLRRVIGLLVLAAGVLVVVRSVIGAIQKPGPPDQLLAPGTLGAASVHPAGPLLGVLGGLLIGVAGLLVLTGPTVARMGSRYDAPGRARAADEPDWWKVLDAGTDPTAAGTDPAAAGGDQAGPAGNSATGVGATGDGREPDQDSPTETAQDGTIRSVQDGPSPGGAG